MLNSNWLTVFYSFINHVTIYGVMWTVGTWNNIFMKQFQESEATISWIGGILNGICCLSGLLSSALLIKHSCKSLIIMGGILSTSGLVLSSIIQCNIYFMYFTFSIMTGLGFGLAYTPSIVILVQCFENKNRSIAMGLASSGVGIGWFIYPSMNE